MIRLRVLGRTPDGYIELDDPPVWLETFDVNAHGGLGAASVTRDPERAFTWPDASSAMESWTEVPVAKPTRPDGKPNRPLTALTVEIEEVP